MPVNRRAQVKISIATLALKMYDTLAGNAAQPPRPVWGGLGVGLHYQPIPHVDDVIVLAEEHNWASTVVPAVTTAATAQAMQPGELGFIRTTDGAQASYWNADGSFVVYNRPAGAAITVSLTDNLNLQTPAGGMIAISAGAPGTLTFTGAATFQQAVTVGATVTATGFSTDGTHHVKFLYFSQVFTGTVVAPNQYYLLRSTTGTIDVGYLSNSNGSFLGNSTQVAAFASSGANVNQFALDGLTSTLIATWTCTGVALGDICLPLSVQPPLPTYVELRAQVTAANTVRVDAINHNNASVALTGVTLTLIVLHSF